jgi:hypothetical protein
MRHYNLLPALIILPEPGKLTFQFKMWNYHFGVMVRRSEKQELWYERG